MRSRMALAATDGVEDLIILPARPVRICEKWSTIILLATQVQNRQVRPDRIKRGREVIHQCGCRVRVCEGRSACSLTFTWTEQQISPGSRNGQDALFTALFPVSTLTAAPEQAAGQSSL
jgi:hypothetical protein